MATAQEELKYTLAPDANGDGRQVDVTVTYDPTMPVQQGQPVFVATAASGTYETLDSTGKVVDTDTITGIDPVFPAVGSYDLNDNLIGIGSATFVSSQGISFHINNAADSDNKSGDVNIEAPASGGYQENLNGGTKATNVSENPVCFCEGTLIGTARGDVAVEALAVGDRVVTASGEHRAIAWLGHRAIDCRRHPRPHDVMPVRIAAHAFGEARPVRDLWVSPGHAICVDVLGEVLVPASALVNGSTIQQVEADKVTYWHVELDSHDILLANGLPAESYIDVGNRAFFIEHVVTALGVGPDAMSSDFAAYCRPLHAEGPIVSAARAQLAVRAVDAGWTLDDSSCANLHLAANRAGSRRSHRPISDIRGNA